MIQNNPTGVATDSTGGITETETHLRDASDFGVAGKNIDSAIDVKVEVSWDGGQTWEDEGTTFATVTSFFQDDLTTNAELVRLNITLAGAAGETGDFGVFAKGGMATQT